MIFATTNPLSGSRGNLISRSTANYAGRGRSVYPGFLQLAAFMSMNRDRHSNQFKLLLQHLAAGRSEKPAVIEEFTRSISPSSISHPNSIWRLWNGSSSRHCWPRSVRPPRTAGRPGAIHRTGLQPSRVNATIFARSARLRRRTTCARDCGRHLNATTFSPALDIMSSVSPVEKWENQIYPQIKNLVLAMS